MRDREQPARVLDGIDWDAHIERVDDARPLYLMRAGRLDDSYGERVDGFDWDALFRACPALFRGFASHARAHRHRRTQHGLPHSSSDTGVPHAPGHNIGERQPAPLVVRVLSPVVHAAIVLTPTVYVVGTAWGAMEQPEWFSNWALPEVDALSFGQKAALRTFACVINYGALYLWKKASRELRRTVRVSPALPTFHF